MKLLKFSIFTVLSILFSSSAQSAPTVSVGKLEIINTFHSKYVGDRDLYIWLPPNYSADKKYETLYMHDGRMLFDATTTWNKQEWQIDDVAGKLIQEGKVKPFIVIGIPNAGANRHSEYFPQKPLAQMTPQQQNALYHLERAKNKPLFNTRVYSDNYLRFIVQEIIPWVEAHYNVKRGSENRYIGGSSMGGLISWYALMEYPNEFAGAFCMSTHWPGTFSREDNVFPHFAKYIASKISSIINKKIYFDHGDKTLDAMYPEYQARIDQLFIQAQFPEQQWQSKSFPGADHTENSWAKRVDKPLIFLLSRK